MRPPAARIPFRVPLATFGHSALEADAKPWGRPTKPGATGEEPVIGAGHEAGGSPVRLPFDVRGKFTQKEASLINKSAVMPRHSLVPKFCLGTRFPEALLPVFVTVRRFAKRELRESVFPRRPWEQEQIAQPTISLTGYEVIGMPSETAR
jgi:hypothetical protein